MTTTEVHLIDLAGAAAALPSDQPIVMLNLIKFKPRTTYPADSPFPEMSGQEAYITHYGGAFKEFALANSKGKGEGEGEPAEPPFKVLWTGKPQLNIVAPPHDGGEEWDFVGVIWYPRFAEFRRWLDSEEYREKALPHRLASIEKYRLFATVGVGV
jgi:hypothetical protein